MSHYSKKTSGYTLVELLVGVVIISILFGVGFAGFRDFSRRQIIESFSRQVKGDLSLARQKAIAGEKPSNSTESDCLGTNTLSGYNFRVVANNSYVLEAVCSGGTILVKTVDTPDGLEISTPETNPLSFKVLSKGTNLSSDFEIVITQTTSGKNTKVFVTLAGEIK